MTSAWNERVRCACTTQGTHRKTAEDRWRIYESPQSHRMYYGIFDGHAGTTTADFLQRHFFPTLDHYLATSSISSYTDLSKIIDYVCLGLDRRLYREWMKQSKAEQDNSGSTAVFAFAWSFGTTEKTALILGCVGDANACCVNVTTERMAVSHLPIHRPGELRETQRIRRASGKVTRSKKSVPRVCGLATSRAFGDFYAKTLGRKHEYRPDGPVSVHPSMTLLWLHPQQQYELLLGSDGFWDSQLPWFRSVQGIQNQSAHISDERCRLLVQEADEYSHDNVTFIWTTFHPSHS